MTCMPTSPMKNGLLGPKLSYGAQGSKETGRSCRGLTSPSHDSFLNSFGPAPSDRHVKFHPRRIRSEGAGAELM